MMPSEVEVLAELRKVCSRRGGATALAKQGGISNAYISKVLSGQMRPGEKMFEALGWRRIVTWERNATPSNDK